MGWSRCRGSLFPTPVNPADDDRDDAQHPVDQFGSCSKFVNCVHVVRCLLVTCFAYQKAWRAETVSQRDALASTCRISVRIRMHALTTDRTCPH